MTFFLNPEERAGGPTNAEAIRCIALTSVQIERRLAAFCRFRNIPPSMLGRDCSSIAFCKIVEAEPESGLAREVVLLSEDALTAERYLIAEATNSKARITQSLDPSFPMPS